MSTSLRSGPADCGYVAAAMSVWAKSFPFSSGSFSALASAYAKQSPKFSAAE